MTVSINQLNERKTVMLKRRFTAAMIIALVFVLGMMTA
jgi:hypothetical protein